MPSRRAISTRGAKMSGFPALTGEQETVSQATSRPITPGYFAAKTMPVAAPDDPDTRDGRRGVNRARAFLSLGLLGAVLFVGAVASILLARPGVLNLAVGLLGVVCMTPAAYALLGPVNPGAE